MAKRLHFRSRRGRMADANASPRRERQAPPSTAKLRPSEHRAAPADAQSANAFSAETIIDPRWGKLL